MTQFKESVIIITGASGGFGQQFARQLLQLGSHLILTDLDENLLKEQAKQIQFEIKTGKVLACWGIDLSTQDGCQTLYNLVKSLKVSVDILINNAGIALFGRMDEVPQEKWEQLMEINLLTPMRLSYLFIPDMIARQKGHIVNISSLAGWVTPEGLLYYCTSKFGLRGFTEGLFNDLQPYQIKVTGVYPFFSRTPILQSTHYGTLAKEKRQVPEQFITDPAKIIERTLKAIQRDQLHVFPDQYAKFFAFLKAYLPFISHLIIRKLPKNS